MNKRDIVERLEAAIDDPQKEFPTNNWGIEVGQLFIDSLAEIRGLRRLAGAVSQGESFAELREKAKGT